jgi:hypothetical protein
MSISTTTLVWGHHVKETALRGDRFGNFIRDHFRGSFLKVLATSKRAWNFIQGNVLVQDGNDPLPPGECDAELHRKVIGPRSTPANQEDDRRTVLQSAQLALAPLLAWLDLIHVQPSLNSALTKRRRQLAGPFTVSAVVRNKQIELLAHIYPLRGIREARFFNSLK